MPATPAAAAALDVLLRQGKILSGDHRAGAELAFLAARRSRRFYRAAFLAAVAVLDGNGSRAIVEAVVLGQMVPRQDNTLERLQSGLDTLHTHFHTAGIL